MLDLSRNQLSEIPEIIMLPQLTELYLGMNRIEKFPPILYFPKLTVLIACNNLLTSIDPDFFLVNMPCLDTLDLSNNQIALVPPRLGLIPLQSLNLMGNVFRVPRP